MFSCENLNFPLEITSNIVGIIESKHCLFLRFEYLVNDNY